MPPAPGDNQDIPKIPACDWCREKKIRCGREKPQCRNCLQRRIQCAYSDRPKRENENTRTAHLFDEVHGRLDRMENTMLRIAAALELKHEPSPRLHLPDLDASPKYNRLHSYRESLDSGSESKSSPGDRELHMTDTEPDTTRLVLNQHTVHRPPSVSGRSFVEDGEGNPYYHGGSSFLAISSEAADGAQAAAKSPSPSMTGSIPLQAADLSEIQEKVGKLLDPDAYVTVLPSSGEKMKQNRFWIPAKEPAMEIIDIYFKAPAWIFPLYDKAKFVSQVEDMYGNLDAAVDVGWLVCYLQVMVFGIYGVLNDKDEVIREYMEDTERMKILKRASKVVWDCLEDTSVLLKPRLLNVQALMMMGAAANEISRPGLCWMLVCNACSLAKTIGLHRNPTPGMGKFTPAEIAERKYVFWTLYILDKSLSLTFGRPSSLADYDIDVELPDYDPNNPLWDLYIAWIETAQIQSEIHLRLYSALAAKDTPIARQRAVLEMDRKLGQWWTKYGMLVGRRYREEHFERSYLMTELAFCYHNTMIMIHRVNTARHGGASGDNEIDNGSDRGEPGLRTEDGVIRGSAIESEMVCLEHARRGINIVRDTLSQKTALAGSSLLMWLFSYYPFTAFFILFSNIIRYPQLATSKDDFRLLRFIVDFLESHKYIHMGAAKLFPVAQSFMLIAARFLDPASVPVEPLIASQGESVPVQTLVQPLPRHPGKRKLNETSHQSHDDDEMRVRMAPLPSEQLLMQYPQEPEIEMTHASFITWPGTVGNYQSTNTNIPHIITTEAPIVSTASYVPTSTAAGGYEYMESNTVMSNAPAWPPQQGTGSDGYVWNINTLGAGALGTYEAGFQDKVAMAAGEGPLGFDWFGWEKWFEGENPGLVNPDPEGQSIWGGE